MNHARARFLIASAFLVLTIPCSAIAAVFTVTTSADAGAGSLRDAIASVNAAPGPHQVAFDIPEGECAATGVCTIVLASVLPLVTEPVTIDGTTQPRHGTAPPNVCASQFAPSYMRVEIDSAALGSGTTLRWDPSGAAGASSVRGLSFVGNAFVVSAVGFTTSGAHHASCNHFAVDGVGTTRSGNGPGVLLEAFADGAIIGTDGDGVDDIAERNVFASTAQNIYINANSNNVVAGNYFGTLADGSTVPSPGCGTGVYLRQASANNRIGSDFDGISDELERNVFAGCSNRAIDIDSRAGTGDDNQVLGNWIGLTADAAPAGNGTGIDIRLNGPSLTDNTLVSYNLIENNTTGIHVNSTANFDPTSTDNCIEGNATGFLDETSVNVVFENMWWGAADGPSGAGPGSGDPLTVTGTGVIDIDPVLAEPCVIPLPEPGGSAAIFAGAAALLGLHRRRRRDARPSRSV